MYRICTTKDGILIEMQSGGRTHPNPDIDNIEYAENNLNILKQNALNAGYKEEDIEVKWVTEEEWSVINAADHDRNYDPSIEIKAKLAEIDLKSIRPIREWIAKQVDAPQYIKDYEGEAVAERVRLGS